jgi:hypothetical protein
MKIIPTVVILFVCIIFIGCNQNAEKNEIGDEIEAPETVKSPELTEAEQEIIKSPDISLNKYKGIWMPFLREVRIYLNDTENLKSDGINIVAIGVKICYDGNITECESEEEIKSSINEFHRNGIKTFLVLNPAHPDFGIAPGSEEILLDDLTPIVLKWAEISERYGVEVFSPVNEPQLLSRSEEVSNWAQEILPDLRGIYRGKLAFIVQGDADGYPLYNLSGYDLIAAGGITCTKDIEDNPEWVERLVSENLNSLKASYPLQKYILFGVGAFTGEDYYYWEPIAAENMAESNPELPEDFFYVSDESQAEFYEMLFNITWNETEGYFIPVYRGWEYRDKPSEKVIRNWFSKNSYVADIS